MTPGSLFLTWLVHFNLMPHSITSPFSALRTEHTLIGVHHSWLLFKPLIFVIPSHLLFSKSPHPALAPDPNKPTLNVRILITLLRCNNLILGNSEKLRKNTYNVGAGQRGKTRGDEKTASGVKCRNSIFQLMTI